MGRREASEYMVKTFGLSCTADQVMEGVNDIVTVEYREKVPLKPGTDALLTRLAELRVPCGIAPPARPFRPGTPWCGWASGALSLRRELPAVRAKDGAGDLSEGGAAAGRPAGAHAGL